MRHGATRKRAVRLADAVAPWQVAALDKGHQRGAFECGESSLDDYIQRYVTQDAKRSLTRAFVLTGGGAEPARVLGYYTLSATNIACERFPAQQAKKLPRYPIPAVLLGRLAVDRSVQGKGLGEYLLVDALKRVAAASMTIGVHAVMVDALHHAAAAFYAAYGFVPLADSKLTMFLPLDTARQLP
jgi:GNAT superfamily N-acetyltransferase